MTDHHEPAHSAPAHTRWPAIVSAVGIIVLAVIGTIALFYGVGQREKGEASTAEKVALAEQVRQACAAGGDAAKELGPACGKAEEITERGEKGEPGATGAKGEKGDKGDKGDRGFPGKAGPTPPCMLVSTKCQGRPGIPGRPGGDGTDGRDGADGATGATGAAGASAYRIAVENGFDGTEAEWLASLKGEKGEPCPPTESACVGPAGRGIESMACIDDGEQPSAGAHWVITYTDDTTQTLPAGSCRQPMPLGQGS